MNHADTLATDHHSLVSMTRAEWSCLWDNLRAPDPEELRGSWRGRLYSIWLFEGLSDPARRTLVASVNALSPWYGKAFDPEDHTGANLFGDVVGASVSFGSFAITVDETAAHLDYSNNPPPLRDAHGELRRLGPGVMLGRVGFGATLLAYFTLEA